MNFGLGSSENDEGICFYRKKATRSESQKILMLNSFNVQLYEALIEVIIINFY